MDEHQSCNDVDDGHKQEDGEEDVGSCIWFRVHDTECHSIVELEPLLRVLDIEQAIDGNHELYHTNTQEGYDTYGQGTNT